jgi:hypothetical protein
VDRLAPLEAVFDVKSNRVLDEVPRFLFGFPFCVAPLQGRNNGDETTVFVPLDYNRELVDLHGTTLMDRDASKIAAVRSPAWRG